MRYSIALSFVCCLGLILGCKSLDKPTSAALEPAVREISEANNALAWGLYQQLQPHKGDILVSPYSLTSAMAMAYAGARGQTAEQIAAVFRFPAEHPDIFSGIAKWVNMFATRSANAVCIQEGLALDPTYEAFMKQIPDGIMRVDFSKTAEATQRINEWVSHRTDGEILDLIGPGMLKPSTKLALVNALYLKADWKLPFDANSTRTESFYVTSDRSVMTPMMRQKGQFPFYAGPAFNAIQLPYETGEDADIELAMRIYLPNQSDGLDYLESFLETQGGMADLPQPWEEQTVLVTLPKFKIAATLQLAPLLKAMGMPIAFQVGKADFSGIANQHDLSIEEIIQKVIIDVDEKGTEAAVATAMITTRGLKLGQEDTVEFLADHPFVFALVDTRTGTILFMGRLTDPSLAGQSPK